MRTSLCHRHKLNVPFSPCYFSGIRIVTASMCIFEETAKIVRKFWKSYLTRSNIQVPSVSLDLLHHNTVTNVDQICRWSAMSFSLVTHTEVTLSPARLADPCSGWFMFGTSYHVLLWKCNKMTSSLHQRMGDLKCTFNFLLSKINVCINRLVHQLGNVYNVS